MEGLLPSDVRVWRCANLELKKFFFDYQGYCGPPCRLSGALRFRLCAFPVNTRARDKTRMVSGFFAIHSHCFFKTTTLCEPGHDFLHQASSPAIKDDINFFLDFDFQPLYTFINCGFLLRTAHP